MLLLKTIRFLDASCREVFAISESGVITTTRGIDRESNFIRVNADADSQLRCIIAYRTDDGNNNTIRIEVTIADVNDNAPEFQNNSTEFSVEEKTVPTNIVTLTVKDPDYEDNGTIDDIVMSGEGTEFFTLTEIQRSDSTAMITLMTSDVPIDFEEHQQFNLTFTITDRGTPPLTTITVVTINVVNVEEHSPMFAQTQYTFDDVPNNSPIGAPIGTLSATDEDEGELGIVLYRIASDGNGVEVITSSCGINVDHLFAVNSTTGVLYLNQSVNGIKCTFSIRVEAYNEGVSVQAGGTAMVHVSIVVARLVFRHNQQDIDSLNIAYEENRMHHDLVGVLPSSLYNYTIEFDREEERQYVKIQLAGNHVLLTFSVIDREEFPFISGRLTVYSDDAQGTLDLHVTVLDVNDNSPVFQITNFSVLENSPIGYEIGRIVAVDPDEGENAEVSYTMLNSSELVTLHSNGSLYVNGMIDFEQVESIELQVIAQDGGTPSNYEDGDINIVIENVNDNLPIFSDENYTQIILTSSSLPITWNVTATDDDIGEYGMVTYRMVVVGSSNDASTFVNLDLVTGQLNVTDLPAPSATPYQLVVEAVDGGNGTNNISIPIHVWTDFCEQSPCANGGTCRNEFNSYRCDCTAEYGGMNCSILKNPCDKISPCRNSATCSDTEDQLDYRCDCTDSYSGRNCMYSSVSFKPRSFQKYQIPGVSADSVHVSMQIAPKSLNGLLLYVGDNNKYISMGLENGKAVVRTQGNGEARDETVMDAGTWYHVTMRKSKMVRLCVVCVVHMYVCAYVCTCMCMCIYTYVCT